MDIGKKLGSYINNNLPKEAKEIQFVSAQLLEVYTKSWKAPVYFTEKDWDDAVKYVEKLNKLCKVV